MNCYVLTGGRSRRMGESKTSMFLDRVVAAARDVFPNVIAVQRAGGETLPIETICELPHDDEAPAFGVARALQHSAAPCFILGVDYPLITSDVLRFLRDSFRGELLVPVWQGIPQMLCAGYGPSMLPRIEARIAARRFDLQGLISEAHAMMIGEAELRARFAGEPLMNVNTQEELEEARRIDERILPSR